MHHGPNAQARVAVKFPGGKKFAFSIFDDTDNSVVGSIAPVYDLLLRLGVRTTKSVWVYPPRGSFTGASLQDAEYRKFILRLKASGVEIALHNVGDGVFSRAEILEGLETFRQVLGEYPRLHANHAGNPDNLYWGPDRFVPPMGLLYRAITLFLPRRRRWWSGGSTPESPHFWGDVAKRHITFIRNLTFNGINLLRYDPMMPYKEQAKLTYSNYWFSSSDGHTVRELKALLSERNLAQLERENGVCIVYTHFGESFVGEGGRVDPEFVERVTALSKRDGWFVPVGELLDFLVASGGDRACPGYLYRLRLNLLWLRDRIVKRIRFGR